MSIGSITSFDRLGSLLPRHVDPSAATAIAEREAERLRRKTAEDTAYTTDLIERDRLAAAAAAEAAAAQRSQETLFEAQRLGQELDAESSDEKIDFARTPRDEFLDYMKKSPGERMIEDILRSMGLTKEDLANMSPEERAKVEALIKEKVEAAMQQATEKELKQDEAAAA
ncbi:hypothetical protein [Desertibaculum subflavum]|uniref:hypothetical protein n=1 Tax=Desertibaculum subflavum TaxID=2268458 RepID=UPI000E668FF7